jgi:hypothetical protein
MPPLRESTEDTTDRERAQELVLQLAATELANFQ